MFHRNRFAYYGDGYTELEKAGGEAVVSYMDNINCPPVPDVKANKVVAVELCNWLVV